jgi:hypothetical protein
MKRQHGALRRSLPSGAHSRDPVGSNAPYELRAAPNEGTISASLTAPFGAAISKRLPFGERSRLERKKPQAFSWRTGRGPVAADYAHRAARRGPAGIQTARTVTVLHFS